jgi:hypothetical protein
MTDKDLESFMGVELAAPDEVNTIQDIFSSIQKKGT